MILSIKSWRTTKKLHKPVTSIYWPVTERKILCVYIHVYQIIENQGPGLYNFVHHPDNRKCLLGLSKMQNRKEAHMFHLAREVGRIWRCSCWDNFITINEFIYGQTWKIWPFLISLSLYSTFKFVFLFCCNLDKSMHNYQAINSILQFQNQLQNKNTEMPTFRNQMQVKCKLSSLLRASQLGVLGA